MTERPDTPMHALNEICIAAITPEFLERGVLWFSEHGTEIKKARETNPLWKANTLFLETGLSKKPSEVVRTITDFGYEKTGRIVGKGTFVWQGNILEVWPINTARPFRIEFFGNTIEEIAFFDRTPAAGAPTVSFRTTLEKLAPGNFVVHLDHGIGVFRGTTTDEVRNPKPEIRKVDNFFVVEYAPPRHGAMPDRLLVPEQQAKKLSPYIGFDTPTVHRLGGTVWFSAKRRVKETTEQFAKELFLLYQKRAGKERPPYAIDEHEAKEFDANFHYEETEDQRKATDAIDRDLAGTRPMDRVVCGDVGFGKTELAMRAAFRAVLGGKQVALIAPTTILARQHFENFITRFSDTAVSIAELSRLTPHNRKKETLKKISAGGVDILIGTHRLLSRDIQFKNLGLVVIDEEQRFGVKQKERFKEMRSDVDILSLSATPIPRTLSLAVSGLRDLSLIETPPPGRIPIKTFVLPYSRNLIKEAFREEQKRGGQMYFLHNRVETIDIFKEKLRRVIPDAHIRTIHGRMAERELMSAMEDFRDKKFNVLLATTIIENGLDFSNVNTLIVKDATRLGLAQAHQLRGRIGRGDAQAYSYFLYRSRRLTDQSLLRLEALQEFAELGAGYSIALRDLELRGAGNVLGREQSGAINKVGFNIYMQMLNEAVEKMKKNA